MKIRLGKLALNTNAIKRRFAAVGRFVFRIPTKKEKRQAAAEERRQAAKEVREAAKEMRLAEEEQRRASDIIFAKRKIERLKKLAETLAPVDIIKVVDIGANPLSYDAPYKPLLDAGLCSVTGFEPQKEAFDKLVSAQGDSETYFNTAVGDGGTHQFHVYENDGLSSLFELDQSYARLFPFIGKSSKPLRVFPIETRRLDDIEEIERIDFLKIDIQGAELAALANAREKLHETMAVQIEMLFNRIYIDQPGFGDVHDELNAQGFDMHGFYDANPRKYRIHNSQNNRTPMTVNKQLLDDDMIYIRSLRSLHEQDSGALKRLALIADGIFDGYQLVIYCMDVLEERNEIPAGTAKNYTIWIKDELQYAT